MGLIRPAFSPWTSSEIAYLRAHAHHGAALLATELGRTPKAVKYQAYQQRISLRRRGSRRGLVLGQTRDVSLSTLIREDLATGKINPSVIARRTALDAKCPPEICPSCGKQPIRVKVTGLCLACHKRELAAHHREALAELEAQRDLWSARKTLERMRKTVADEIGLQGAHGYPTAIGEGIPDEDV